MDGDRIGATLLEPVSELPPASLEHYLRASATRLRRGGGGRAGVGAELLRQLSDPRVPVSERDRLEGRAQALLEAWCRLEDASARA